jgi:hypothetical protein
MYFPLSNRYLQNQTHREEYQVYLSVRAFPDTNCQVE